MPMDKLMGVDRDFRIPVRGFAVLKCDVCIPLRGWAKFDGFSVGGGRTAVSTNATMRVRKRPTDPPKTINDSTCTLSLEGAVTTMKLSTAAIRERASEYTFTTNFQAAEVGKGR